MIKTTQTQKTAHRVTRTTEARRISDLSGQAHLIATAVRRAAATGLDERAYQSLRRAGAVIDPRFESRVTDTLMSRLLGGGPMLFRSSSPFPDDRKFIERLVTLRDGLAARLTRMDTYIEDWTADLDRAVRWLKAERNVRHAKWLWGDATRGLDIIVPARELVWLAVCDLNGARDDLDATYQAIYDDVRDGLVLPDDGRFIGEGR